MEKISFTDPVTKERTEFYVEEETKVNGVTYLLVTEEQDKDCDAFILREVAAEHEDLVYEMVEDETELAAIGKLFAELIEDTDIEFS